MYKRLFTKQAGTVRETRNTVNTHYTEQTYEYACILPPHTTHTYIFAFLIKKHCTRLFLLGHQPVPKS